jgi:hypothetical protein
MHARVAAISASVILLVCVSQFICFGCDSFARKNPKIFSLLQYLGTVAKEPPAISADAQLSIVTAAQAAAAHHQRHPASSIIRHKV